MINLLEVKTSVLSVLSLLRTMIAMMVGGFVWVLVNNALGQPPGVMVLLPVWIAGLAGGAVCTMYSARQGIPMAAVSGLLLALLFLWFRHVHRRCRSRVVHWSRCGRYGSTAYYLGAYAYVLVLLRSER